MKRILFIIVTALLLPYQGAAAEKPIPRTLIALYDSRFEATPHTTDIHHLLEMPANHLGYGIRYYDVTTPLPVIGDDVAGVIIWFNMGTKVPDVPSYLKWLKNAASNGRKLILIENGGIGDSSYKDPNITKLWNDILSYIGMQDDTSWNAVTYNAKISTIDSKMMEFERKITPPFPPLSGFHVLAGSKSISHLQMRSGNNWENNSFDLVITNPNGGFIAPGYAVFVDSSKQEVTLDLWYVNPFLFLQESLGERLLPIPDTTTLDGKRIFYSHIDGDGWNNLTEIERYRDKAVTAADVISKEILVPYSDFVFDVGLITADVDPECFAAPDSERVAREIFALPNVEPSSHTYSHPLYWQFFENYTPDKEKPYLKNYPLKPSQKFSLLGTLNQAKPDESHWTLAMSDSTLARQHNLKDPGKNTNTKTKVGHNDKSEEDILKEYNYMPRSYACSPFNLDQEINGAVKTIKALSPPGKKVRLLQWPGNTTPFEGVMTMTRQAGLLNLNGGDSRFDKEYPSYSSVAPIGIQVGNERQIFASDSNEETYTELWTKRFYGFRYLQDTVKNTESPIRISPFNLYFHMFSGEKEAGLNAIKENLDFARRQDIIPVTASDYASIANGFFSTRIIPSGENSWHIQSRGSLQTIRFDNADSTRVNFAASHGVLGQYLYQNSLYVTLDPAVEDATVAIYKGSSSPANTQTPYLIQSNWQVRSLQTTDNITKFEASGYGNGLLKWQGMGNTIYQINIQKGKISSKITVKSNHDGVIEIPVSHDLSGTDPVTISMAHQ